MPNTAVSSNKAKIARRVVEVLDFFDDDHREATVMDIVRKYGRPQSSTSELLSSLVELGLLHKDLYSRTYRLTARAALMGSGGQPEMVRDGRLVRLLDRLVAQTGYSVALFAKVGLEAQVISWRNGRHASEDGDDFICAGMKEPLACGAAGWLMLSTISAERREGAVRRLNAEANETGKFCHAEMMDRIARFGESGHGAGPVGFGTDADIVAALVPGQPEDHPLAVGIVHERSEHVNRDSLLQCIGDAMRHALPEPDGSNVRSFPTAA